ncbi:hypothetical protein [Lacipirellula sp.]|uniref:hypothetical protein n=1 Tax=Lacipirellula sp. TaxID=2691419 RepID=UPI003D10869F
MRPLLSVTGAAVAALLAFRSLYSYDILYPLRDGAVIGGILFGGVKVAEWLGCPRLPAWAVAAPVMVATFALYLVWLIALMS